MLWKEVSPGRFERESGDLEWFYQGFLPPKKDGQEYREHWMVSTVAKLSFDKPAVDVVFNLSHAWKAMRYDHPDLAVIFSGRKRIYQAPRPIEVEQWLAETFIVLPDVDSGDMLAKAHPNHLPLLYYLPKTSEVVFVASHSRIDGIGTLQFMHNFCTSLANPRPIAFGDEGQNLAPDFYDTLQLSTKDVTPESDKAADSFVSVITDNFPSYGLPTITEPLHSVFTRRFYRYLSLSSTKALLKACKDHKLGFTAAVHAALAISIQNASPAVLGAESPRTYNSWCISNLRSYTNPPTTSPLHPLANYHAAYPTALDRLASFNENASFLTKIYSQPWNTPYVASVAPSPKKTGTSTSNTQIQGAEVSTQSHTTLLRILYPFVQKLFGLMATPPPAGVPEPSQPTFSSLGNIERQLPQLYETQTQHEYPDVPKGLKVTIEDFWVGIETASGPWARQPVVHQWIWKNKLYLGCCFDASRYEEQTIKMLVEGIFWVLGRELDVKMDFDDEDND